MASVIIYIKQDQLDDISEVIFNGKDIAIEWNTEPVDRSYVQVVLTLREFKAIRDNCEQWMPY